MTFDEMLEAFCDSEAVPVEAIEAALADWDACGPRFRAMLHGYVCGEDLSEQTERSLHVIVHLLAEKADTASFADLCLLGEHSDRFDSVYGPSGAVYSFQSILVSTFGGDPAPLLRLVDCADADDYTRSDALLVLTYLACSGRVAEPLVYEFLSRLPPHLPGHESELWHGYARAVAMLGFAGLSSVVDGAFKRGEIDEHAFTAADFWRTLRDTQANGRDLSDAAWPDLQPIVSAVDQLTFLASQDDDIGFDDVQQPIRNPLRSVGRNDPCPCGSGKKYKKCCLQAAAP